MPFLGFTGQGRKETCPVASMHLASWPAADGLCKIRETDHQYIHRLYWAKPAACMTSTPAQQLAISSFDSHASHMLFESHHNIERRPEYPLPR